MPPEELECEVPNRLMRAQWRPAAADRALHRFPDELGAAREHRRCATRITDDSTQRLESK